MTSESRRTLDLAIVTGPHRSGTTFLASVLSAAERTVALGVEPLNVTWGMRGVSEWYPEVRAGDDVDRLLQRLSTGERVAWNNPSRRPRERLSTHRRARARNRRISTALHEDQVVIMKDPFLSLSLDYATSLTSRPIVVTVRHPAAWSLSLRRVAWHPGELLESIPRRRRLSEVAHRLGLPDREWRRAPLFEAAAWTWTLLVAAAQQQADQLGDRVLFMPLERFEGEPVQTGLSLIDEVGLRAAADSRAAIELLTLGTTTTPTDSTTHVLQRDTTASLGAWRSVITPEDREIIWEIAAPVASPYYEP